MQDVQCFQKKKKKIKFFCPQIVEKNTLKSCTEKLKSNFFSLLPAQPKQKNSCSKMWPIDQLYIDTQLKHKSKRSENLGRCGRQNMLRPYLTIWEWEWIFGHSVKATSSPGVRSLCLGRIYLEGNLKKDKETDKSR